MRAYKGKFKDTMSEHEWISFMGLPKKIRLEVLKRDGFKCQYCKGNSGNKRLVVDHIIPKHRGGTHDLDNLITSCNVCNSKKGTKTLIEWIRNEKVSISA